MSADTELRTPRLRLEPLTVDHAEELAPVLADPALYVFTGGEPPTVDDLRRRYAAQVRGPSADGTERWRNWVVRQIESGAAIGFVQATITGDRPGETADVAWVIGVPWQGRGYATEAARAMARRLGDEGVATITAHVYPDHTGSERVAERLGLAPTDAIEDGERVWRGVVTGPRGEVVDPERRRRIAWVNVAVSIALMAFAAFDALMARSGATPSGPDQVIRDLVLAGAGIALLATTLLRRGR